MNYSIKHIKIISGKGWYEELVGHKFEVYDRGYGYWRHVDKKDAHNITDKLGEIAKDYGFKLV